MTANRFIKDPNANLDYTIDWETWLDGDTIDSSVWSVPDGITQTDESNTSDSTTVWLSGGTAGNAYLLNNRVITALGRIDDRSLVIWVGEYTDFECLVIGTVRDVTNQPVAQVKVFVLKVQKSGSVIQYRQNRQKKVSVSDENGIVAFSLPRDCTAWIEGSFFSGSTDFSGPSGVRISIPDDETANLEDLGSAASGPTTGLTVQIDDVPLNGLYTILNFVSPGIVATPGDTGVLNISVLSGGESESATFITRETPTPSTDGIETVFTLSDTPILGSEEVFVNGLLQEEGSDYTMDEDEITMTFAPDTLDKLRVSYRV